jgi:hypothetical protein
MTSTAFTLRFEHPIALPGANAYAAALRELWASRMAAPALVGAPPAQILETVEDRYYHSQPS